MHGGGSDQRARPDGRTIGQISGEIGMTHWASGLTLLVADRIRRALPFVAKERVILAPDCGMKYLPRDVAVGKLRAMVAAARMLREEFAAA